MSKLQDLLAKIQARSGRLPVAEEMDDYLQEFILHKMPHSETLQEAFEVGNVEMEMLYAEGYAYYEKGEFEDSTLVFQWLAILNPFLQKYWMGLGGSSMMLKDYEKALKFFAMGSLTDGDDPMPHYYASVCYDALNDQKERLKALNLARARAKADLKYADLVKKIQKERIKLCQNY